MLDKDIDEHCGCKRPHEDEDSNDEESVPLENDKESIKVAKQLEEDMSYFDSDEELNKSEYT